MKTKTAFLKFTGYFILLVGYITMIFNCIPGKEYLLQGQLKEEFPFDFQDFLNYRHYQMVNLACSDWNTCYLVLREVNADKPLDRKSGIYKVSFLH